MTAPSQHNLGFPITLTDFCDRSFRLTEERWHHILSHPEHGEEGEALKRIEDSVRLPDCVVRSRTDYSVELFYRWYEHTLVGDKYLCVVTKTQAGDPFILTAYFTDAIKQGEELWNKLHET